MADAHFTPRLFSFLKDLARHNDREWFNANKERYERDLKAPKLAFIADIEAPLMKLSPHLVADPSPNGGSMFRSYRDVRFSPDKRPYKTHAAAQFRHEAGKDVHAPGRYLHLAPGECFCGGGVWRPDSKTLKAVRAKIDEDPKAWKKATRGKSFVEHFTLGGEQLKRAPKGYDPDHPEIEDLRRKDFASMTTFKQSEVTAPGFVKVVVQRYRTMAPFMRFLTDAIGVDF